MNDRASLTPLDCDLRDFAFMPLDVIRLRDSDLAATESPEACWAAVLLWCAAWHQVPAASLPDDDRVLANLAGFGRVVKEWQKIRDGALRGWVKCSDGRLYHPVIAEKAIEAWRGKQERQWRTECARIKKHAQRHDIPYLPPEFDQWLADGCPQGQRLDVPGDINKTEPGQNAVVPETSLGKSTPQGQGQGQGNIKPTSQPDAGGKFAMHADWQPSDHVAGLARQSGAPLIESDLPEFIAYWLTQPDAKRTQAEWDKALQQSAKHRKLRADAEPQARQPSAAKPAKFDPVAFVNGNSQGCGHGRVIDHTA